MVQTYNEFATLHLDTKLMFCRVRIKKLLENVGDRFRNFFGWQFKLYGLNSLIVDIVQEVGNGVGTPSSPGSVVSVKVQAESHEKEEE